MDRDIFDDMKIETGVYLYFRFTLHQENSREKTT